ncbi:MAG: hypothetical protein GEU97_01150 [Actinophytocola sp.]|nr:hypothetical protein [Actinophytocola sp.]
MTEADGYPTVAAAMRDLADHGIDVTGDSNDPEIRCEHCAASGPEPHTKNGQRPTHRHDVSVTEHGEAGRHDQRHQ